MTYRRGWIALLIFSVVIINYIDRVALSVAAKPIAAEFGFTPVQMGYLFSGFLWTYVVCLVPLGLMVERIGAKKMVAAASRSGLQRRLSPQQLAVSPQSSLPDWSWEQVKPRHIQPVAA